MGFWSFLGFGRKNSEVVSNIKSEAVDITCREKFINDFDIFRTTYDMNYNKAKLFPQTDLMKYLLKDSRSFFANDLVDGFDGMEKSLSYNSGINLRNFNSLSTKLNTRINNNLRMSEQVDKYISDNHRPKEDREWPKVVSMLNCYVKVSLSAKKYFDDICRRGEAVVRVDLDQVKK